jgi:glycine hydroxymethyltransferase
VIIPLVFVCCAVLYHCYTDSLPLPLLSPSLPLPLSLSPSPSLPLPQNFTSKAVMQSLGSCLTNKYSEGLPAARYYGGNEFIDKIEVLCQQRALKAFHLDEKEWGVNVQPYSGSPANLAVYTALLKPHDRIMGLDLPSGGHLTHGFQTAKKKISATSIFFESMPYRISAETGLIDYDALAEQAKLFLPKILICGASAYPRDFDYKRLREIADSVGAYLMCDMAHVSGLVASQLLNSPFEYCDVVTTTTHKSLRGPRSGMIFFKRTPELNLESRINFAVFPGLQGGPHNHQIAGVAVQLLEVATPEFVAYSKQVIKNIQALAKVLMAKGYKLVTDGTDNHLLLWDLRPLGITGSKVEALCDKVNITLNKNSVLGDRSALSPGGVRIGSPALTSRGLVESDFEKIGEYLERVVNLTLEIQKVSGKKMVDFNKALENDNDKINALRAEVEAFAKNFYMPGFTASEL